MDKISKKYGKYYGELMSAEDAANLDIPYYDWSFDETIDFVEKLKENNVTNIIFDCIKGEFCHTIFFDVNDNTNYRNLMVLFSTMWLGSFEEVSKDTYGINLN